MPDPLSFALAVIFVLAMPGPTNTLLATAAATSGLRNCWPLMPAEMAGYAISIGTLVTLVRPIAETSSTAGTLLRIFCAGYLFYMAWRLWQASEERRTASIRFPHVFITTLLNPKGLVFAFLIFPPVGTSLWVQSRFLGLFMGICAVICACWLSLGAVIGSQAGSFVTPMTFRRGAAIALSCFACFMLLLVTGATAGQAWW
jgi:threonine/homoserine/homoserine lactone efflux protein